MDIPNQYIIKINEYFINHKSYLNKEVGENIRKIRKQKRISRADFSERSGISLSYMNQIETGEYGLTLIKLINICNALEISPNELLNEFIIGANTKEDKIYNELQKDKNISLNILNYLKN